MQQILAQVQAEPKDYTYIGIGSCPHCGDPEKLEDRWDQLMPMFVREVPSSKTLRIIHIDPAFYREEEFLTKYFAEKLPTAIHLNEENLHVWINDRVEVIILSDSFDQHDHEWFMEHLIEIVLADRGQLVLQEYTGYDTAPLYRSLYEKSLDKALFKTRILFDVTYGTDEGCGTDMTKYRPITDSRGNFFNTVLCTVSEIKAHTGFNTEMDKLILKYITGLYRRTLNQFHVDYRRRLKGETTVLYECSHYTHKTEPEDIMLALQRELTEYVDILRKLKIMTPEKDAHVKELFKEYKRYDIYKWYDEMSKII